VFYGANGAGKTSILEAISLFSSDRGLRKASVADLNRVHAPSSSWHLELVHEKNQYKTFLSTYVENGRRQARIDNACVPKLSQFEDFIWLLWVVPSMNNLFIGHTAELRSFFDHLVSGYDREHKARLKKLSYLQKERLHIIFHRKDENWLDVIEEKIAIENLHITQARLMFIQKLHETFITHNSDFLRPIVSISGDVETICAIHSEEDAILEIAAMLKNYRYEDSERQTTVISAHKSLWTASHSKSLLNAENCSTGEQKAFLISIILAVVRIYQQSRSGVPVLFLDDLMMHLDQKLRNNLIQELLSIGVQTFFTGTDRYIFEDLCSKAQVYHVEKSICTLVMETS
jgi:DNA replication and repair protein RecF